MQIVIDIDDEIYDRYLNYTENYVDFMFSGTEEKIVRAFRNGTPLPKGHGRLIDADILEKEIVNGIKAGNYEEGYESYAHINSVDDVVECVKYADTIIEAEAPKKRKSTPLEENDTGYSCEDWIP